jgi:hypothetical protein
MPEVGFELTITVSEQAKTAHISDRAVTVTGISNIAHGEYRISLCRTI